MEEIDDGMDITYLDPPLICCFGAVQKEFVPSPIVSEKQMHPDRYLKWRKMQWKPVEFGLSPVSYVAISHVRLGGRAEVMGKVGKDKFGEELVRRMNKEGVQTRSVKLDANFRTGCSYMKVKFNDDGRMIMVLVKEAAEDSLFPFSFAAKVIEADMTMIAYARIFHFNSEVLTSPSMRSTLFKAINLSKKFGGLIFFDLNLPLSLWKSRDETKEIIKQAWNEADVIEVSWQELKFFLDEDHYKRKGNYRPQYYAENYDKDSRDCYHYTREEISPLWHDKLKFLFVTDGTLRIHYYSPLFDGVVAGTEEVLITPSTCDRMGSGNAVVAGIMRKLTTFPEMYEDRDVLERQLRLAIVTAGIISQCTNEDMTETATRNLKEELNVSSMW
ncbi:hypothetical protein KSS87_016249 [Heliosperma pusillum]|nr:hypothetical protein KSS87_016249 [Heliosperma pusillum]